MAIKFNLKTGSCSYEQSCLSKDGCPPSGVCPDFAIKRHDTKPPLRISMSDCNGPMDFTGLVIEVNMWALSKLKSNLAVDAEYFRLADDIGFNQVMVGDVILVDQVRSPEKMLVLAFDEKNKLIRVQRGYGGTSPSSWDKGTVLRIFKILNGRAYSENVLDDVQNVDGSVDRDVLQESNLIYDWRPEDTCLPGCYWLEFKIIKMIDVVWYLPGGNWVGEKHQYDGFFYTGSTHTSSSVILSYNQIEDKYILPKSVWNENNDYHLHSDEYFTGDVHDDGSVILKKNNSSFDSEALYDEDGIFSAQAEPVIPDFTPDGLTPIDFACILGEGVEWVRRYPLSGEGFLIKIENSFTSE